jgi:hypothetical protein
MKINNKVERLAEINRANTMMEIGEELRFERQYIVNFLKISKIIELEENGGFHFIGDKANEYKELYLDSFNNF